MQEKRHYKLYKSGKQWVTCALTGVAVVAGLAISDLSQTTSSAHAAQVRVSKADLQKQLGWSTNYKLTDSNKAQYAQLQANIAAAKALMNNRRATPAQIKAAIDKLHNTGLIMIKTSQDALIKQLGWSTAYNPDNVGAKEYAQLQAKVKAAQALIKSGKATAAQLEAIRNDLHTTGVVVAKTEPVVAAQKLEQQLGWSTGYTQDNLSPEQYQALQDKIKTAKALLASGKATAADLRNIQASLHATGVTIVETKSVAASSAAASSAAASSAAASSAAASSAAASSAAASSAAAKSAADAAASEAAKQPVYVPPVYVPPVTVPVFTSDAKTALLALLDSTSELGKNVSDGGSLVGQKVTINGQGNLQSGTVTLNANTLANWRTKVQATTTDQQVEQDGQALTDAIYSVVVNQINPVGGINKTTYNIGNKSISEVFSQLFSSFEFSYPTFNFTASNHLYFPVAGRINTLESRVNSLVTTTLNLIKFNNDLATATPVKETNENHEDIAKNTAIDKLFAASRQVGKITGTANPVTGYASTITFKEGATINDQTTKAKVAFNNEVNQMQAIMASCGNGVVTPLGVKPDYSKSAREINALADKIIVDAQALDMHNYAAATESQSNLAVFDSLISSDAALFTTMRSNNAELMDKWQAGDGQTITNAKAIVEALYATILQKTDKISDNYEKEQLLKHFDLKLYLGGHDAFPDLKFTATGLEIGEPGQAIDDAMQTSELIDLLNNAVDINALQEAVLKPDSYYDKYSTALRAAAKKLGLADKNGFLPQLGLKGGVAKEQLGNEQNLISNLNTQVANVISGMNENDNMVLEFIDVPDANSLITELNEAVDKVVAIKEDVQVATPLQLAQARLTDNLAMFGQPLEEVQTNWYDSQKNVAAAQVALQKTMAIVYGKSLTATADTQKNAQQAFERVISLLNESFTGITYKEGLLTFGQPNDPTDDTDGINTIASAVLQLQVAMQDINYNQYPPLKTAREKLQAVLQSNGYSWMNAEPGTYLGYVMYPSGNADLQSNNFDTIKNMVAVAKKYNADVSQAVKLLNTNDIKVVDEINAMCDTLQADGAKIEAQYATRVENKMDLSAHLTEHYKDTGLVENGKFKSLTATESQAKDQKLVTEIAFYNFAIEQYNALNADSNLGDKNTIGGLVIQAVRTLTTSGILQGQDEAPQNQVPPVQNQGN